MVRTISAAGTTSSSRQPFVAPTSMNSMNRTTCPVRGSAAPCPGRNASLRPRLTTTLTLTGARGSRGVDRAEHPGDGEVDVVHRAEDLVVGESRLTVTRVSPAAASPSAFCARARRSSSA